MGKTSSGSQLGTSSTPAIEILGINSDTRSVLFRQGSDIFTARQSLDWTPAHENPALPLGHQVQSPSQLDNERADWTPRQISGAAQALRENLATIHNVNGSLAPQLMKTGQYSSPPRHLAQSFLADALIVEANEIPAQMQEALNRALGPLPVSVNPATLAKAQAAFSIGATL